MAIYLPLWLRYCLLVSWAGGPDWRSVSRVHGFLPVWFSVLLKFSLLCLCTFACAQGINYSSPGSRVWNPTEALCGLLCHSLVPGTLILLPGWRTPFSMASVASVSQTATHIHPSLRIVYPLPFLCLPHLLLPSCDFWL